MENLNAEQIKKALESCTRGRKNKDDRPCLDCPYNECNLVGGTSERQTKGTCQGWLMRDALALINELTEEIADLKAIAEQYQKQFEEAKAGAVRKMAERLTKEFDRMHKSNFITVEVRQWIIDQIAKEMLEA